MSLIRHIERNTIGRDFAVGDIHGYFTLLQAALDAVKFDPARDRLFSVGDLVDRGPESDQVLDWLTRPWFFSVQGNHEDIVARYVRERHIGAGHYLALGGAWLMGLPTLEQQEIAAQLADLPVAIEVETEGGLVGLVHADCPVPSWPMLRAALCSLGAPDVVHADLLSHIVAMCQWSRTRIDTSDKSEVDGIRAVVVGHTPVRRPVLLGNVYHIDTGAWLPGERGYFTLLDLGTLQAHPQPIPHALDWEAEG
ncbi:Serine/threonine-protein phosphatase 1 [compost metagenome]